MRSNAFSRFCSGSGPHDICTRATRNFSGGKCSQTSTDQYSIRFRAHCRTDPPQAIASRNSTSPRPPCKVVARDVCKFYLEAGILKQGNHSNSHQGGKAQHGAGHGGEGKDRHLHNPIEDRLIPLEPLDLGKVHSIDDLVRAMSKTAFTGRQLGEAVDVLEAMARDEECFVVMTLAGAMTVAKQGLIVTELIDRGIVNAVLSTGALMAHGLVEATGRAHFRHNPEVSDEELYEQGYNRVYDTLEPEQNLDDVEEVMAAVLEAWDHNEIMCSYKLNHAIGEHLARNAKDQRGILKSAYDQGVPVFVPAFTDSELGLDTALNNRLRESTGRHRVRFDPFEDLEHFAATLLRQKKLA